MMLRIRSLAGVLVAGLLLVGSPALGEPSDQNPMQRVVMDRASRDVVRTPRPRVPAPPLAASPLPEGFVPDSTYGPRISPRTGRRTFHAGADFLAPRGTPVRAVRAGVVERIVRNRLGRTRFGGYGRGVVIRHDDVGRWTFYAHLEEAEVVVGQRVVAGQRIGAVGNSSNRRFRTMPPHLHLEVRRAAPGGRSPFPGRYRRHNQDPLEWLESMGVRFARATPPVQPS